MVIKLDRGRVVGFAVNLSYLTETESHDVLRYDTAHGYMHVHRFWISREVADREKFAHRSMEEVFEEAYSDIKENWAHYIELFRQEVLENDES